MLSPRPVAPFVCLKGSAVPVCKEGLRSWVEALSKACLRQSCLKSRIPMSSVSLMAVLLFLPLSPIGYCAVSDSSRSAWPLCRTSSRAWTTCSEIPRGPKVEAWHLCMAWEQNPRTGASFQSFSVHTKMFSLVACECVIDVAQIRCL